MQLRTCASRVSLRNPFTFGMLIDATGGYDVPIFTLALASTLAGLVWLGIDAGTPVVPPRR